MHARAGPAPITAADDLRPRSLSRSSSCPSRRPGEHDAEQEQHDDGADVDEHLGDGDELRGQQDELAGHAGEHDDQPQGGVHDVLGGDDADGADDHDGGDDVERDVLGDE